MRLLDNKAKNSILKGIEQAIGFKNFDIILCFDLIIAFLVNQTYQYSLTNLEEAQNKSLEDKKDL